MAYDPRGPNRRLGAQTQWARTNRHSQESAGSVATQLGLPHGATWGRGGMGMKRGRIGLAIGLSLALGAIWAPVGAQGAPINTTMSGTFDDQTFDGTFSVDSGPLQEVCSGGTTHDDGKVVKETRQGLKIVVLKSFTCDEGGTFVLQLSVLLDFYPTFSDTFSWVVKSSGGGLEGLRGAGTGYGDDLGDHYAGRLNLP